MQIYSETYGKSFEFEAYETEGKSTGPKHASIQKVIYEDIGAKIEVKVLKADPSHGLVQVTLTDETRNRSVVEIGEALSSSLSNEISNSYPVTMAFNRGFDRAALRLLGLYGLYAESEGVMQSSDAFSSVENNQESAKKQPTNVDCANKQVTTTDDDINPDEVIYPYRKFNGESRSIRYIYENEKETFNWALEKFQGASSLTQQKIYKACLKLVGA